MKVGVLVGVLLPPTGSMLTATAAGGALSGRSETSADPAASGVKVTFGAIVLEPRASVQT